MKCEIEKYVQYRFALSADLQLSFDNFIFYI